MNEITPREMYASCCNFTGLFSTTKSFMGLMLTLPDLWNIQASPRLNCVVNTIIPQELPAVCSDVLHIKISDKFGVNLDILSCAL